MNHGKLSFVKTLLTCMMLTLSGAVVQPPKNIRAVVSVLDICGQSFVENPVARLKPILFGSNMSLQSVFNICSRGKTQFTNTTVYVVPQRIPIYSTCYTMSCDFYRWADDADAWITKHTSHGVQNHMIYVLPNTTSCPWAGLGYTSCSSYPKYRCRVWINGIAADSMDTYFHELGHNIGLLHANSISAEYGDASCAMGYCCWSRCYNAPHNEQLGWASPLFTLDTTQKRQTRRTYMYVLPAARSKEKTYLRIHTPSQWIYVEYRKRVTSSIDSGLPRDVSDAVNIYTTPPFNALGSSTVLQASLQKHTMAWMSREGIRIQIMDPLFITGNTTYVRVGVYT